MADQNRFPVNPDILRWAIEESDRDYLEVIERFPNIDKWINKDREPTMRQLEEFSRFTYTPFGYMFLSKPPKPYKSSTEFRTINNKLPNMSKNLKDTIKDMEIKQNWLIEYRKELGYEILDIFKEFEKWESRFKDNYRKLAKVSLDLIDMDYDRILSIKNDRDYYKILRNRLEDVGISVFQNGVVIQNNYRTLDIKEFRAFALPNKIAPLIFINNNDSVRGKIFSLVHEYVHILYNEDDMYVGRDYSLDEELINNITAEILIPENYILDNWNEGLEELNQINELSRKLKVSKHAISIRLLKLRLITEEILEEVIKETNKNLKVKKSRGSTGGDYYNTLNSRLSDSFKVEVISSVETGATSYTEGMRLLNNISGKVYKELQGGVII